MTRQDWPPDPRFNAGEDPQGILAYEPKSHDHERRPDETLPHHRR